MNIPSTTSKEAFYILECEENYAEKQDLKNNSRTRILNMTEKLEKVKMEIIMPNKAFVHFLICMLHPSMN